MLIENIKKFQDKHPKTFLLSLVYGVMNSKYEMMVVDPSVGVELVWFNHLLVSLKGVLTAVLIDECGQSTLYLKKIYEKLLYDDERNPQITTFIEHFNIYIKYYTQAQSEMEVFISNLVYLGETIGLSVPLFFVFGYIYLLMETNMPPSEADEEASKYIETVFQTVATNLSGSEEEIGNVLLAEIERLFEDDRDRIVFKTIVNSGFKLASPYIILTFQHFGNEQGRYRSAVLAKAANEVSYAYGNMVTTVEKVMEAERELDALLAMPTTPFSKRVSPPPFDFDRLTCSKVACRIKGERIFDNMTFTFDADSIGILKGPSGSGKSTLLTRIAQRFYDENIVFEGTMILHGRAGSYPLTDVETVSLIRSNSFCYFGNNGLFSHGTIRENFKLYIKYENDDQLRTALTLLEMDEVPLEKRVCQLSLGQQQRVLLSFLLASNKQIYFLDEPLSHLNEQLAHHCATQIVKHVQQRRACLIVVDHTNTFEQIGVPKTMVTF